jgi:hypothetical protein
METQGELSIVQNLAEDKVGWLAKVVAYKNDSPSSLGSRRRENERRKKTHTADCPHDSAFPRSVLDA